MNIKEKGNVNYHYTENRYNHDPNSSKFDNLPDNSNEILKGKEKGRILNTNAESGYETWNWENKYNQKIPPKDYFEQYEQGKKIPGGILKSNAESGSWNFASREYNDPDAIKRFNMRLQNNNNNNNFNNNNYNINNNDNDNSNNYSKPINSFNEIPQDVIYRADLESQNLDKNYEKNIDIQKIETSENFVFEGGIKKKITKIVKYLSNGEVKTEIFKTNA